MGQPLPSIEENRPVPFLVVDKDRPQRKRRSVLLPFVLAVAGMTLAAIVVMVATDILTLPGVVTDLEGKKEVIRSHIRDDMKIDEWKEIKWWATAREPETWINARGEPEITDVRDQIVGLKFMARKPPSNGNSLEVLARFNDEGELLGFQYVVSRN